MKLPESILTSIQENKDQDAFYIYDMKRFRKQMDKLSVLPRQVKTFYAMKVNPNVDAVKEALTHQNIEGIEIASMGEMRIVGEAGGNLDEVIYTGPSKSTQELYMAIRGRIRNLNAESLTELLRINGIAEHLGIEQGVLLRLNTKHNIPEGSVKVDFAKKDTQFGIPRKEVAEYVERIRGLENVRLEGLHMYPASGIVDYRILLDSVRKTFETANDLEAQTGFRSKVLDFGGGFGIDYSGNEVFDISAYANGLEELIIEFGMEETDLYLELGRYLGADMGYFVTRVNDIKTMESGKKAVLCHAGTNAHKRAGIFPNDRYKTLVVPQEREPFSGQIEFVAPNDTYDVFGPLCTPVDIIARDRTDSEIRVGDYIVQTQVGAYGRTMSPQQFLSHSEIPEIILR